MLSILSRILLTGSAVAPVSLTFACVAFYQGSTKIALICILIASFFVISCLVILHLCQKNSEILPFKAVSLEPSDAESFGFMLIYVLPLFTDKIESLNWELWIPISLFFFLIISAGYGYHFNPLLSILQWHFYKVTSEDGVTFVLITKKHLRAAAGIRKVAQLTEYILIDIDCENDKSPRSL